MVSRGELVSEEWICNTFYSDQPLSIALRCLARVVFKQVETPGGITASEGMELVGSEVRMNITALPNAPEGN